MGPALWHSLASSQGGSLGCVTELPPQVARGTWVALPAGKWVLSAGAGLTELVCTRRYAAGVSQSRWLCFWPDVKAQEIMPNQTVVLLLSGISMGHQLTLAMGS